MRAARPAFERNAVIDVLEVFRDRAGRPDIDRGHRLKDGCFARFTNRARVGLQASVQMGGSECGSRHRQQADREQASDETLP